MIIRRVRKGYTATLRTHGVLALCESSSRLGAMVGVWRMREDRLAKGKPFRVVH